MSASNSETIDRYIGSTRERLERQEARVRELRAGRHPQDAVSRAEQFLALLQDTLNAFEESKRLLGRDPHRFW